MAGYQRTNQGFPQIGQPANQNTYRPANPASAPPALAAQAPGAIPTGGYQRVQNAPRTVGDSSTRQRDAWMNTLRAKNGTRDVGPGVGGTGAPGATGGGGNTGYGTESGPGILEQWFNQRANGTDPAYEYGMGRGMDAIDRRMAAGGSFNSGARGEQLSDFAANMGALRMGQLDSLAGGASGEHQGRINSMFAQGMGLAGGQAGLAGQYDIGAGNAMSAANQAILMMMLNKAGVDSQATQGFINNLFSGLGLAAGRPG